MAAATSTPNPVILSSIYNLPPSLPRFGTGYEILLSPVLTGQRRIGLAQVTSGIRRKAAILRIAVALRGPHARPQLGSFGIGTRTVGFPSLRRFRAVHRSFVLAIQDVREKPMAEATQNRCAHPQCTCPVEEGEQYCSQACSDAAEGTSRNDRCACPHPKCAGAMAA
jgi:hypothetical protein